MPHLKLPGRYKAEVIEASVGQAKTGTDYVNLLLRTDDGEVADTFLYLSEKAFERSVKTLVEVFAFDGDFDTIGPQTVGKRCSITAELEEDDRGDERVRIKWINPEQQAPADKNLLARLTQRARALGLKPGTAPVSKPTPTPKPATPSVTPIDEDEIPF